MNQTAPAISEQDMHLLPVNMRELAAVVGIPAFTILVEHYGGGFPLRIPNTANPDHALWELIGADAFRALVARYQGEKIEIAKCERAARELQRRSIRYEFFTLGHSQEYIAHKYRFTVRHIRNIAYYISEPQDDRNGSLF